MVLTKQLLAAAVTILIFFSSCRDASEDYLVPKEYTDLIKPYAPGDSLKFRDSRGKLEYYVVEKLDSAIFYGGAFSHNRSWKDIRLDCRMLSDEVKGSEAHYGMIINKPSWTTLASIELRLKGFYNVDVSPQLKLRKDTTRANDIAFTDYYLFHARELSNDPDPVVAVYMKPVDGIIAYRTISGNWWTRCE